MSTFILLKEVKLHIIIPVPMTGERGHQHIAVGGSEHTKLRKPLE